MKKLTLIIATFCCMALVSFAASPKGKSSRGVYPNNSGSFLRTNPREPRSKNNLATEPFMKTQVQAQLRMEVGKEIDQVHFIRTNNDPYVVTKTYILKHADPYEIRPFILRAVQANRVIPNNTHVECIKYNDGVGAIIVSAEQYRFKKLESGMTVDEIVASLDKPGITTSSGQTTFLYFPKYWAARDLSKLIKRVGANVFGDNVELQFGRDHIQWDTGLNAMLMYLPRYNQKNIERLLRLYDCPTYQVEIGYKLYEIYAENDAKIGVDFQAWKNNAGADLFGVGGRYRDGWSATFANGANKSSDSSTSFLNFNPKWNTRYLDFLASKGKGKIMTQGKILIMSQTTGSIELKNNIFNFENDEQIESKGVITGALPSQGSYVKNDVAASSGNEGSYRIQATDSSGTVIDFTSAFDGTVTATKMLNSNIVYYALKIASGNGGSFSKAGRNLGLETQAFTFILETCVGVMNPVTGATEYEWQEVSNWTDEINLSIAKGYTVATNAASNDYGFKMNITPEVNEESAIVSLRITNDSLIGWKSDGSPRISRDTDYNTKIMINNKANKFVIGGMEKRTLVPTVTGVPYLKDIPILGYVFSSENPTTKRSRLIMVMECKMKNPDDNIDKDVASEIRKLDKKVGNAGEKLPLATQQYFLGRD